MYSASRILLFFKRKIWFCLRARCLASSVFCDCCNSTVFLQVVKDSFAQAAAEPKLTSREQLVQRNAAVLAVGSKAADVREGLSGSGGSSNTIQRERHAQYSRYCNREQKQPTGCHAQEHEPRIGGVSVRQHLVIVNRIIG
jgi:hypothetical protein